jgi:uncharacterized protein (TIGR02646 family)
MRRIVGGVPPKSFSRYRAARATYGELSADKDIRRALRDQQKGLCAYCERRLRDVERDDHRTRIEHFHPQAGTRWDADCQVCSGAGSQADSPTTWTNLLLCCDGNEHAGEDFTCDKLKNNTDICSEFRNPRVFAGSALVVINAIDGTAQAAPGLPAGAGGVVDEVLNLNAKHLIDARLSLLQAIRRELMPKITMVRSEAQRKSARAQIAARARRDATESEYPSVYLAFADRLDP